MTQVPLNATLIDRHDVSEELAVIRVKPDSGVAPAFEPGQYITIGLPDNDRGGRLVRRAYSIASARRQHQWLEFYIVLVREGRLTPHLWQLPVDGRLWIDQKAKGRFTLDRVPDGMNLVMVATGTGIAPYMSMLRSFRGQNRWRRFVVIHGVRLAQDLGYRQELLQAAAQDASVVYLPTVTRDPVDSSWTGLRGRVQTALESDTFSRLTATDLAPETCHVFLCGNPTMVAGVQSTLEGRGFVTQSGRSDGNLHVERYW